MEKFNEKDKTESWYVQYLLIFLIGIGGISMLSNDILWKTIGFATVLMTITTFVHIIQKRGKREEEKRMANDAGAILLLIALAIGGLFMTFNILEIGFGIDGLRIGFDDIVGVISGFYILIVKIVGLLLTGISIWAIYKMITS